MGPHKAIYWALHCSLHGSQAIDMLAAPTGTQVVCSSRTTSLAGAKRNNLCSANNASVAPTPSCIIKQGLVGLLLD
jgi:hypothetical protein